MAIWIPGSGMTYTQFLQTSSFNKDIQGAIKINSEAVAAHITSQTRELVANNHQLSKKFGEGFDSINNTLQWGFNGINDTLENIHRDFNLGIGLLATQLEIQNKFLHSIDSRLDRIQQILEKQLDTKVRELFDRASDRFSKGLLKEALCYFVEAESIYKDSFFTQYALGKLFLYGKNEYDDVVDLDKANEHLQLAVRYGRVEIPSEEKFRGLVSDALFHQSISLYAKTGEREVIENKKLYTDLISQAIELADNAIYLNPNSAFLFYQMATYHALLGKYSGAIKALEEAIQLNIDLAVKVTIDNNFDLVRDHVNELLNKILLRQKDYYIERLRITKDKYKSLLSLYPTDPNMDEEPFNIISGEFEKADTQFKFQNIIGYYEGKSILAKLSKKLENMKKERIVTLEGEINDKILPAVKNIPQESNFPGTLRTSWQALQKSIADVKEMALDESTLLKAVEMAGKLPAQKDLLLLSLRIQSRDEQIEACRKEAGKKIIKNTIWGFIFSSIFVGWLINMGIKLSSSSGRTISEFIVVDILVGLIVAIFVFTVENNAKERKKADIMDKFKGI